MQLITLEWIVVIVIIAGTFGAIAYEVIEAIITMQEVDAERNKPRLTSLFRVVTISIYRDISKETN